MRSAVYDESAPRSGQRLLWATWSAWLLSVVATPLTAYLAQAWVPPAEDDDFGMGPLLGGAFLGALASVLFGIAALVLGSRLRAVRPLRSKALSIVERLVLILPVSSLLIGFASVVGVNPVGGAVILLGAVVIVLISVRV